MKNIRTLLYKTASSEAATQEALQQAAAIIRRGGLVAFPTETVYGLGADAFNRQAVRRIYAVKGRPSDNPLILHVHTLAEAALCADFTPLANLLADAFWPGPFTMVLPKNPALPKTVNNGMATVAVRMPAHPIAQALIRLSGCVIAAPSANVSGRCSPTCAAHVAADLADKIDMLIDGGDVSGGLESTVLDVTTDKPRLLRPGIITPEQITAVTGTATLFTPPGIPEPLSATKTATETATPTNPSDMRFCENPPLSPGMKYKHYAPRALMTVVTGTAAAVSVRIRELAACETLRPIGILATAQTIPTYLSFGAWQPEEGHPRMPQWRSSDAVILLQAGDRDKPLTLAQNFFAALRHLDALGVKTIYAEGIAETGVGLAVMNRMEKAAGYRMVNT